MYIYDISSLRVFVYNCANHLESFARPRRVTVHLLGIMLLKLNNRRHELNYV